MKFTVNRKKMSDMLGLLAPIANRRSPLPILSNVLIDARDSTVTLTSTMQYRILWRWQTYSI